MYAIAGQSDGTFFVDITHPRDLIVLGFLETAGTLTLGAIQGLWRDIKVVNGFVSK